MEPKFTKGPWHIFGDWGIQAEGETSCLATFESTRVDNGTNNSFDNAYLIASAPDMYSALSNVNDAISKSNSEIELADAIASMCHDIDQLLKKARGE